MNKRTFRRFLCLILALACLIQAGLLSAAADTVQSPDGYYYKQLLTAESRAVYEKLDTMDLESGTAVADVTGIFNDVTSKDAVMADFVAARDAYMLDHNLFYVDFDKLSLTHTGSQILVGIGREDTYLADGFVGADVDAAVTAFDAAVTAIANAAKAKTDLEAQVRAAYDGVMAKVNYALEKMLHLPMSSTSGIPMALWFGVRLSARAMPGA